VRFRKNQRPWIPLGKFAYNGLGYACALGIGTRIIITTCNATHDVWEKISVLPDDIGGRRMESEWYGTRESVFNGTRSRPMFGQFL
jgi:hypothetical protein